MTWHHLSWPPRRQIALDNIIAPRGGAPLPPEHRGLRYFSWFPPLPPPPPNLRTSQPWDSAPPISAFFHSSGGGGGDGSDVFSSRGGSISVLLLLKYTVHGKKKNGGMVQGLLLRPFLYDSDFQGMNKNLTWRGVGGRFSAEFR